MLSLDVLGQQVMTLHHTGITGLCTLDRTGKYGGLMGSTLQYGAVQSSALQ